MSRQTTLQQVMIDLEVTEPTLHRYLKVVEGNTGLRRHYVLSGNRKTTYLSEELVNAIRKHREELRDRVYSLQPVTPITPSVLHEIEEGVEDRFTVPPFTDESTLQIPLNIPPDKVLPPLLSEKGEQEPDEVSWERYKSILPSARLRWVWQYIERTVFWCGIALYLPVPVANWCYDRKYGKRPILHYSECARPYKLRRR